MVSLARGSVLRWSDRSAIEVKLVCDQNAVAQPRTAASEKASFHSMDLALQLSVVVPRKLGPRPSSHGVGTEKHAICRPLATDTMQEPILVDLFGGECPVSMPHPNPPMRAAFMDRCLLTDPSVSMKNSLDGGAHDRSSMAMRHSIGLL